jgi:predicted RNA binding protein YcfA (HicA-like mRNA interferase family)
VKAVSGKQLCRLLEDRGWVLRRVAGSHHIDSKIGTPARISVPVHGNTPLKIGLQRHLMKLAGIMEYER